MKSVFMNLLYFDYLLMFLFQRNKKEKKLKISSYSLPNLQLTHCGIKMNIKVYGICKKTNNNNNLPKFRPPLIDFNSTYDTLKPINCDMCPI